MLTPESAREMQKLGKRRMGGRTRGRAAGQMNKQERALYDRLRLQPDVAWIAFEGITLLLGSDCRLTPDFALRRRQPCGCTSLEFWECKGFREDDSLAKLRTAATLFPWDCFVMCEWKGGEWVDTPILPAQGRMMGAIS